MRERASTAEGLVNGFGQSVNLIVDGIRIFEPGIDDLYEHWPPKTPEDYLALAQGQPGYYRGQFWGDLVARAQFMGSELAHDTVSALDEPSRLVGEHILGKIFNEKAEA